MKSGVGGFCLGCGEAKRLSGFSVDKRAIGSNALDGAYRNKTVVDGNP